MRNLTIQRKSVTLSRFAKMNVFIEDAESSEITLNGSPCRKIGVLEIGQIKTFSITEDAVKIIVATDQEGGNSCLWTYSLEEGTDDVVLVENISLEKAGQLGFRFDPKTNQVDPKPSKKHRVWKRWLVRVLIMAICVFGIRSCADKIQPEPKTFSVGGFNITLTTDFEKEDDEESFAKFSSKDVIVYVDKHFSYGVEGLEGLSLEDFTKQISEEFYSNSPITKTDNGLIMIQEEVNSGERNAVQYYLYSYKTFDAFWTVEFMTYSKNVPKYQEQIEQWASSVEFYK